MGGHGAVRSEPTTNARNETRARRKAATMKYALKESAELMRRAGGARREKGAGAESLLQPLTLPPMEEMTWESRRVATAFAEALSGTDGIPGLYSAVPVEPSEFDLVAEAWPLMGEHLADRLAAIGPEAIGEQIAIRGMEKTISAIAWRRDRPNNRDELLTALSHAATRGADRGYLNHSERRGRAAAYLMLLALDPHAAYKIGADFEDLVDTYRALAPPWTGPPRGSSS